MTQATLYGVRATIPQIESNQIGVQHSSSLTLDAAGEMVHYTGQVYLAAGSGSKTISSAGGKIHWRSGTTTFANAGTTLRIGIQDVSTTTSPTQGDGTHDVYADLVGGTDTISNSTNYQTAMETGTKTISHGDKVSIVLELTARGGADSVTVATVGTIIGSDGMFPATTTYLSATWARNSSNIVAMIEFDDGTLGWFFTGSFLNAAGTLSFNLDSAIDEIGNYILLGTPTVAAGLYVGVYPTSNAADFEVNLYSDPLGTPVLIESITFDATMASSTTLGRYLYLMFSTPRTLSANTAYGITIRPTTTTNIVGHYINMTTAAQQEIYTLGQNCYAISRAGNTGAFTDYNSLGAKTRRVVIGAMVQSFDDGAGAGGGGGMRLAGHGGLAA